MKKANLSKYASVLILLGLIIVCAVIEESFFTPQNLLNVSRQISVVTILAFGETLLIIAGQLDLSVGANAAMSGTFACIAYLATGSLAAALITGIILGGIVGVANGIIVTQFSAPPFIVTLAMQQITNGIIFLYTNGQNVYKIGDFRIFGQGSIGPVPIPVLLMLLIFTISLIILKKTKYGRYLYAIGGNEECAIASGIKVKKTKIITYTISGLLAGLGGVVLMSRLNAGLPASGIGLENDALMSTIIGGTSFTGGIGTAFGTLIGSFIIGILNNIMNLIGVQSYLQYIFKGSLIVVCVVFDIQSKQRKRTVRIIGEREVVTKKKN